MLRYVHVNHWITAVDEDAAQVLNLPICQQVSLAWTQELHPHPKLTPWKTQTITRKTRNVDSDVWKYISDIYQNTF